MAHANNTRGQLISASEEKKKEKNKKKESSRAEFMATHHVDGELDKVQGREEIRLVHEAKPKGHHNREVNQKGHNKPKVPG